MWKNFRHTLILLIVVQSIIIKEMVLAEPIRAPHLTTLSEKQLVTIAANEEFLEDLQDFKPQKPISLNFREPTQTEYPPEPTLSNRVLTLLDISEPSLDNELQEIESLEPDDLSRVKPHYSPTRSERPLELEPSETIQEEDESSTKEFHIPLPLRTQKPAQKDQQETILANIEPTIIHLHKLYSIINKDSTTSVSKITITPIDDDFLKDSVLDQNESFTTDQSNLLYSNQSINPLPYLRKPSLREYSTSELSIISSVKTPQSSYLVSDEASRIDFITNSSSEISVTRSTLNDYSNFSTREIHNISPNLSLESTWDLRSVKSVTPSTVSYPIELTTMNFFDSTPPEAPRDSLYDESYDKTLDEDHLEDHPPDRLPPPSKENKKRKEKIDVRGSLGLSVLEPPGIPAEVELRAGKRGSDKKNIGNIFNGIPKAWYIVFFVMIL